jgi:DNA-directed RNA polymerase specialized sigma24 family protein
MDKKTADWYEYIESLVENYKAGDSESGLALISAFEPYLKKFGRIIKDGYIDLKDKDSRKFICLFIPDAKVRYGLRKHYQSKEVRNAAYKAVALLNKMCESLTMEDMKQDLYVILLSLCKRYVRKGTRNFCGYTYNVFRYELHRRLVSLYKDPLTFWSDHNITYNDEYNITPNQEFEIEEDMGCIPVVYDNEELGNNWVRGLSCDEVFLDLTTLQRLILKKYYIDGFSDYKIADNLGMHRNTILRNRMKAEDSIAQALGDEFIDMLQEKRSHKTNVGINIEDD